MLSPLDLIKGYFSFKSYFSWFLITAAIFGLFLLFKRKRSTNHPTTTWKGYLTYFLIILGLFSFICLFFFYKPEPSSKYYDKLINEIDKAIDKYEETINNYHGLRKDWEKELKKCEDELKELSEQQELTQAAKDKIKTTLDNNEKKMQEIQTQLSENTENITILKGKLIQLEKDKEIKEKEIQAKEEQLKLASLDDQIRLEAEIKKLQGEKLEIVGQMGDLEVQIGKLESRQRKFQELLSSAEKFKQWLEEQHQFLTDDEKSIFNQYKSVQNRYTEILKNIDEIKTKITIINMEKEQLKILRVGAEAAKTALDDWDKKHEFSFGNLRDALFQGSELYMDTFGGRGMLKAVGGGVTKEAAGGIAKAGLVIHEAHRVVNLAKELFCNADGTLKMMSKETYDSICARIDRDLAKLDDDYKDYEKKMGDYKNRLNQDNLIKDFLNSRKKTIRLIESERSIINEYTNIIDEIHQKQKEVYNTNKLYDEKANLEEWDENLKVTIETKKEELKQKNPNYARAQQRYEEQQKIKKYAKFYQPIINK